MTDACLKRDGNVLDSIGKLTMSVRTGSKIFKQALSKVAVWGQGYTIWNFVLLSLSSVHRL